MHKLSEEVKKLNKQIAQMTKRGDIKGAIECCQNAIQNNPDDANLHVKLGDLYMDWHLDIYQYKQYIDEAITQYQIASESFVDNGEIYYKIGFAFYHKGELDRAISYFNLALKNNGDKAQCHFMLAQALKKKDRYTEALEEVDEALKHTFLRSSRIHYLKHRLLRIIFFSSFKTKLQSKLEFLLSWLTLPFDREAINTVLNKIKIMRILPKVILGDILLNAKEYDKAIACFMEAVDKMPGFAILYCKLGCAYKMTGQYDEAIVEFKTARWTDSLCLEAYHFLAQTYEEIGDYDNAIFTYQKYIQIHPNNALLHSNIANLYFMKGDVDKAISHYQSAISLNPKHNWTSVVAQTLGYIEQNITKNLNSAIASFHNAYILTPNEIDVYVALGSAFYDKEDFENALIIYRRALELNPKNAQIHCNLGYLHWSMGDINEAIKEYDLSIKYNPDYSIAHNNLGVIYLDDLAHIRRAIECFQAAIDTNPNYALAYYNMARAMNIKGEKIEAAKYYQMAYDINTVTGEIDPAEIQERLNNLFD